MNTTPIHYIDSTEFHTPGADAVFMVAPPPRPPREVPLPGQRGFALLCLEPLLSRLEEPIYFRKMNYLRFKAESTRQTDPESPEIAPLLNESIKIRNLIVEANLRLIALACRLMHRDLTDKRISDSAVTLIRAVGFFDVSNGNRFSTYAMSCLRRPEYVTKEEFLFRARCQSAYESSGETTDLFSVLEDTKQDPPDRNLERIDAKKRIRLLLDHLENRDRAILELRYGLNGDEPQTFSQIGDVFGFTGKNAQHQLGRVLEKSANILQLVESKHAASRLVVAEKPVPPVSPVVIPDAIDVNDTEWTPTPNEHMAMTDKGICCPVGCDTSLLRLIRSSQVEGGVTRRLVCDHCDLRFTTFEKLFPGHTDAEVQEAADRIDSSSSVATIGVACPTPGCGCRNGSVRKTKPNLGYTKRRRICDRCGLRVTTIEKIAGGYTKESLQTARNKVAESAEMPSAEYFHV